MSTIIKGWADGAKNLRGLCQNQKQIGEVKMWKLPNFLI